MNKRNLIIIANTLYNRGEYKLANEVRAFIDPILLLGSGITIAMLIAIIKEGISLHKRNKVIQSILDSKDTPKNVIYLIKESDKIKKIYSDLNDAWESILTDAREISYFVDEYPDTDENPKDIEELYLFKRYKRELERINDNISNYEHQINKIHLLLHYQDYIENLDKIINKIIDYKKKGLDLTTLQPEILKTKKELNRINKEISAKSKKHGNLIIKMKKEMDKFTETVKNKVLLGKENSKNNTINLIFRK